MEADSVSVDVVLNEEDHTAFCAYLRRLPINRPSPKTVRFRLGLIVAVEAAFFVGFLALRMHWGAWLMLGAEVARVKVRALIEKRNCAAALPSFNGRLSIESSGLKMERPGSTTWITPASVIDITITDRHVFICFGFGRGWVVPMRCFETSTDAARATSILGDVRQLRPAHP